MARTHLGAYGKSGSSDSLRRGLGHYTRTGLGGARTAAQRMRATARNAGTLYGVLDDLRRGATPQAEPRLDAKSLAGLPQREIADRIAQAISPTDGTLDAEAGRESMAMALTELVQTRPEADLSALSPEDINLVVESYVATDICKRIELDVGKSIFDKSPNAATAVRRLDEMHRFVRQCVRASFHRQRKAGTALTRASASKLVSRVIRA
jgi:hypothetical protein